MVTSRNVFANFRQIMADFFAPEGGIAPANMTSVSWPPLYHDMGLQMGIIMPILAGMSIVLTSPMGFFRRPARWMQLLGRNGCTISAAPNFAYELAARRTSDDDLAGLDLAGVHTILNGGERVQPATLKQFADRFARFNFNPKAIRPCYGMAEATVYIATRRPGEPPAIAHFDVADLAVRQSETARRRTRHGARQLRRSGSMLVRIVDPQTRRECPDGTVRRSGCMATTSPAAVGKD